MESNRILNIVYDNPYPHHMNCKEIYTDSFLMEVDAFIKSLGVQEENINRFDLDEVIKSPDKKFYYFVTLTPDQVRFKIEKNINPVPEKVIDIWKNYTNLFIVFANEHEWESFKTFETIHNWIGKMKLRHNQFYLVNNNSRLKEYKEILNSEINVHSTTNLKNHIGLTMSWVMKDIPFLTDKKFLFLCHNRKIRSHRYALLCLLKREGLLEYTDWSLTCGWDGKNIDIDSFYGNILSDEMIKDFKSEFDYFHNIDIKKSFFEEDKDWFREDNIYSVDFGSAYETNTYSNSYFNIITETEFDNEVIHITEKSLKPFVVYQFPIFCSSPNHIKELKNLYDFDIFEDVIDHSYDSIEDHKQRLISVKNEIKRIFEKKDMFVDFYKNNQDRFIKNRNLALDLINDKKDKNWLNTLL